MFRFACTFALGVLVGSAAIPEVRAQLRTIVPNRLLTVDLAEWCAGKEVTVEILDAGPGTSGKHYHPGYSFTYILEGSEEYLQEGQPGRTVKVGDVLYEPPMVVHTVTNQSPVKTFVVRLLEKGKPVTVRVP